MAISSGVPFASLVRASRVSSGRPAAAKRLAGVRGPPAAAERLAGVGGSASELPAACWRGRALAGVGGSAFELFNSPDGPLAALKERLQAVPSFALNRRGP